jgi:hypothetical protein
MFRRANKGLEPPSKDSFPSTKLRVTRPTLDCHSLKTPYIFWTSLHLHNAQFEPSSVTESAFLSDLVSTSNTQFLSDLMNFVGCDSVVGIETRYALDGLQIESRWGEIFRTSPGRPWG